MDYKNLQPLPLKDNLDKSDLLKGKNLFFIGKGDYQNFFSDIALKIREESGKTAIFISNADVWSKEEQLKFINDVNFLNSCLIFHYYGKNEIEREIERYFDFLIKIEN